MEGSTQELRQVLSTPPPNWQPPPGPPPNPITILHASLEHLRNTGDEHYLFLRTLLEVLNVRGFFRASSSNNNGSSSPPPAAALSMEEEQLLFHCATGLRHVVLFRWESFQPSFRCCVRDLLLAIGLGVTDGGVVAAKNNNNGSNGGNSTMMHYLPRTVTMACLSCASSFWKRGWTAQQSSSSNDPAAVQKDDQQSYLESLITNNLWPGMQRFHGEVEAQELFGYLNSRLASPFEQQQQPPTSTEQPQLQQRQYTAAMSASFLSLLVGEFTGGNSSARYNLPVEFHRLCHHLFESGSDDGAVSVNCKKSGLDATLNLSMTALSSLVGYILNNTASSPTGGSAVQDESLLELGSCVIDVTCDVLSWEFGAGASKWDFSSGSSRKNNHSVLLRPPQRWREVLINPEFLGAMFNVYTAVRVGRTSASNAGKRGRMAHLLRQLLLLLSSISGGPIFSDENERGAYAGFLLDGCLNVLESILNEQQQHGQLPEGSVASDLLSAEIVDLVTILSRLTTNFRIQILSQLPSFPRFLAALCTMGRWLLESSLSECQRVEGDVESLEGVEWKNDAIAQILQCSDAMADDYWLASGSGGQEAVKASQALASMLAPLYGPYCTCRIRMACLEEHYMAREGAELDEIREEISAFGLEEEMASAASLGRLNVLESMKIMLGMLQQCMPRLMSLFEGAGLGGEITPDMAALLEEARMLLLCAGHLLTDDCAGETPAIPESVIQACQPGRGLDDVSCTASIAALLEMLKSVAEAQVMKVVTYPADPRLSPLLAKTLLWFFRRWGPSYILPNSDEYRENTGGIFGAYSTAETAQPLISFCTTLCLLYFCHWPQEKEVQDESTSLLLSLGKKGAFVRELMLNSPSFQKTAALHSVCASLRHNASPPEISAAMAAIGGDLSIDFVRGYQRVPYADRARILTCLVVACSDMQNEKANAMLNGCLKAVEAPFSTLITALGNKQASSKDINVQESACLSILLYGGIVLASEMSEPERIPHFITPSLPHLSGLMTFYAEDLTICESLLKIFRDYAEQYINMMTRDQSIDLFTASASLLKHYSEHHCQNRVVQKRSKDVEEEFDEDQKYNDVLCAIQLLIHLGTKDFTNLCNTATSSSKGVETGQITDVIFFGLQQILPLMTQGLLQYPTLCQHYFSLVGFMVETYPERLCALPFDLFNSLLDSLLFGMSHSDPLVSKSSLQGLASLAKEHLKTGVLATHLSTKNDIFSNCTFRLIQEVVFQPIIWDRLESAGMALLPLAAIDVQQFIGLVNAISQQLGSEDKKHRLHTAFEQLIKPEMLAKVGAEGREGRIVRVQFKKDFDMFVRDVQSFLVMK
ncbi:hypothetical protein ACHAXR_011286 [Thalassiosira sp. AJA248-18]